MRLSHFIGACAAVCGCIAVQAQAAPSAPMRDARMSNSAACDAAKRSAWFERQRELTDGDVDPTKVLPTPRECMDVGAMQGKDAPQAQLDERVTAERRKDGGAY